MGSDKTEKKRKRDSDRHDRPSKKPALAPQNLPPLKASVLRDDSEFAPVLGIFFSKPPILGFSVTVTNPAQSIHLVSNTHEMSKASSHTPENETK